MGERETGDLREEEDGSEVGVWVDGVSVPAEPVVLERRYRDGHLL